MRGKLEFEVDMLSMERDEARSKVDRLERDFARCLEVQKATAEGWRHEVAEVAAIVGAPPHTAELAACVRAEIERLRTSLSQAQCQVRTAKMIAARVQAERDATRAEIERLRRERDEALVESAQRALSVIALERDDARAEVERLRKHFEAASPEHNLPALLDLYDARRTTAEDERDEARAEVERLRIMLASREGASNGS